MGPSSSATFEVVDISEWNAEEPEDMGARDKLWVTSDAQADSPSHLWKQARSAASLPEYGADSCAERIAVEIARLMGAVTVHVELAVRSDSRGVISERIPGETAAWQRTAQWLDIRLRSGP